MLTVTRLLLVVTLFFNTHNENDSTNYITKNEDTILPEEQ